MQVPVGVLLDLSAHQLTRSVGGFNSLIDFKWPQLKPAP
jgi:hypothetical protein